MEDYRLPTPASDAEPDWEPETKTNLLRLGYKIVGEIKIRQQSPISVVARTELFLRIPIEKSWKILQVSHTKYGLLLKENN